MQRTTWREWLTALVGAWFVISAWALPSAENDSGVFWNDLVFGLLTLIAGAWTALDSVRESTWREWLAALFSAWLAVSPWVLGFTHLTTDTWVTFIAGAVGAIAAAWTALAPTERSSESSSS
ncbi:MAG: SPW repeat protein [Clostridia bacterium]|nr:SPW repeat protein [Clostridia bacterium]